MGKDHRKIFYIWFSDVGNKYALTVRSEQIDLFAYIRQYKAEIRVFMHFLLQRMLKTGIMIID